MVLRQRASIIGLSVFLLLPLTFLSSAFMAPDLMPGWMQTVAGYWRAALGYGGLLLGLAVFIVWLSTLTFRGYRKAV